MVNMADGVCCWHLCFMRGDRIRSLWPCFAPAATPNRNQQEINTDVLVSAEDELCLLSSGHSQSRRLQCNRFGGTVR